MFFSAISVKQFGMLFARPKQASLRIWFSSFCRTARFYTAKTHSRHKVPVTQQALRRKWRIF
jgi:hypothetical protein